MSVEGHYREGGGWIGTSAGVAMAGTCVRWGDGRCACKGAASDRRGERRTHVVTRGLGRRQAAEKELLSPRG